MLEQLAIDIKFGSAFGNIASAYIPVLIGWWVGYLLIKPTVGLSRTHYILFIGIAALFAAG